MGTVIDLKLAQPAMDVDGKNRERAEWAQSAVDAFRAVCGTDEEDAVADLICNLLHLAEAKSATYGTPNTVLRRATGHFMSETGRAPW